MSFNSHPLSTHFALRTTSPHRNGASEAMTSCSNYSWTHSLYQHTFLRLYAVAWCCMLGSSHNEHGKQSCVESSNQIELIKQTKIYLLSLELCSDFRHSISGMHSEYKLFQKHAYGDLNLIQRKKKLRALYHCKFVQFSLSFSMEIGILA